MRKIIYFINPISGTKNKESVLAIIKQRTTAQNIPFEILHTNAEGDYNYLQQKIVDEKITDVIICGGDGTVNQVANYLQKMDVNVGIIPLGSGNGLALAAKISKNTAKALDIIFAGKSDWIDAFYLNKKFSCMLCGLGFDAQVAHDFAKQPKRGLATYVKQSLKNFMVAKPYSFTIWVDDEPLHTEAFFISIANSNQFGNNFTIAPKASLQDGLLDIVIVNKMSKARMVWTILKQIKLGQIKPYEDKKYHSHEIGYFQAKKIKIENLQLAPLHIDGDPAETSPIFEAVIVEKAFKLLMP